MEDEEGNSKDDPKKEASDSGMNAPEDPIDTADIQSEHVLLDDNQNQEQQPSSTDNLLPEEITQDKDEDINNPVPDVEEISSTDVGEISAAVNLLPEEKFENKTQDTNKPITDMEEISPIEDILPETIIQNECQDNLISDVGETSTADNLLTEELLENKSEELNKFTADMEQISPIDEILPEDILQNRSQEINKPTAVMEGISSTDDLFPEEIIQNKNQDINKPIAYMEEISAADNLLREEMLENKSEEIDKPITHMEERSETDSRLPEDILENRSQDINKLITDMEEISAADNLLPEEILENKSEEINKPVTDMEEISAADNLLPEEILENRSESITNIEEICPIDEITQNLPTIAVIEISPAHVPFPEELIQNEIQEIINPITNLEEVATDELTQEGIVKNKSNEINTPINENSLESNELNRDNSSDELNDLIIDMEDISLKDMLLPEETVKNNNQETIMPISDMEEISRTDELLAKEINQHINNPIGVIGEKSPVHKSLLKEIKGNKNEDTNKPMEEIDDLFLKGLILNKDQDINKPFGDMDEIFPIDELLLNEIICNSKAINKAIANMGDISTKDEFLLREIIKSKKEVINQPITDMGDTFPPTEPTEVPHISPPDQRVLPMWPSLKKLMQPLPKPRKYEAFTRWHYKIPRIGSPIKKTRRIENFEKCMRWITTSTDMNISGKTMEDENDPNKEINLSEFAMGIYKETLKSPLYAIHKSEKTKNLPPTEIKIPVVPIEKHKETKYLPVTAVQIRPTKSPTRVLAEKQISKERSKELREQEAFMKHHFKAVSTVPASKKERVETITRPIEDDQTCMPTALTSTGSTIEKSKETKSASSKEIKMTTIKGPTRALAQVKKSKQRRKELKEEEAAIMRLLEATGSAETITRPIEDDQTCMPIASTSTGSTMEKSKETKNVSSKKIKQRRKELKEEEAAIMRLFEATGSAETIARPIEDYQSYIPPIYPLSTSTDINISGSAKRKSKKTKSHPNKDINRPVIVGKKSKKTKKHPYKEIKIPTFDEYIESKNREINEIMPPIKISVRAFQEMQKRKKHQETSRTWRFESLSTDPASKEAPMETITRPIKEDQKCMPAASTSTEINKAGSTIAKSKQTSDTKTEMNLPVMAVQKYKQTKSVFTTKYRPITAVQIRPPKSPARVLAEKQESKKRSKELREQEAFIKRHFKIVPAVSDSKKARVETITRPIEDDQTCMPAITTSTGSTMKKSKESKSLSYKEIKSPTRALAELQKSKQRRKELKEEEAAIMQLFEAVPVGPASMKAHVETITRPIEDNQTSMPTASTSTGSTMEKSKETKSLSYKEALGEMVKSKKRRKQLKEEEAAIMRLFEPVPAGSASMKARVETITRPIEDNQTSMPTASTSTGSTMEKSKETKSLSYKEALGEMVKSKKRRKELKEEEAAIMRLFEAVPAIEGDQTSMPMPSTSAGSTMEKSKETKSLSYKEAFAEMQKSKQRRKALQEEEAAIMRLFGAVPTGPASKETRIETITRPIEDDQTCMPTASTSTEINKGGSIIEKSKKTSDPNSEINIPVASIDKCKQIKSSQIYEMKIPTITSPTRVVAEMQKYKERRKELKAQEAFIKRHFAGVQTVPASKKARVETITRPIRDDQTFMPTASTSTGSKMQIKELKEEEAAIMRLFGAVPIGPASKKVRVGTITRPIEGDQTCMPTASTSTGSTMQIKELKEEEAAIMRLFGAVPRGPASKKQRVETITRPIEDDQTCMPRASTSTRSTMQKKEPKEERLVGAVPTGPALKKERVETITRPIEDDQTRMSTASTSTGSTMQIKELKEKRLVGAVPTGPASKKERVETITRPIEDDEPCMPPLFPLSTPTVINTGNTMEISKEGKTLPINIIKIPESSMPVKSVQHKEKKTTFSIEKCKEVKSSQIHEVIIPASLIQKSKERKQESPPKWHYELVQTLIPIESMEKIIRPVNFDEIYMPPLRPLSPRMPKVPTPTETKLPESTMEKSKETKKPPNIERKMPKFSIETYEETKRRLKFEELTKRKRGTTKAKKPKTPKKKAEKEPETRNIWADQNVTSIQQMLGHYTRETFSGSTNSPRGRKRPRTLSAVSETDGQPPAKKSKPSEKKD